MKLLMPLLIKVTGSFGNMVLVHNIQDLVAYSLAVPRAFANKAHHVSKNVGARNHTFCGCSCERDRQRILVLDGKLLSQTYLRVL